MHICSFLWPAAVYEGVSSISALHLACLAKFKTCTFWLLLVSGWPNLWFAQGHHLSPRFCDDCLMIVFHKHVFQLAGCICFAALGASTWIGLIPPKFWCTCAIHFDLPKCLKEFEGVSRISAFHVALLAQFKNYIFRMLLVSGWRNFCFCTWAPHEPAVFVTIVSW